MSKIPRIKNNIDNIKKKIWDSVQMDVDVKIIIHGEDNPYQVKNLAESIGLLLNMTMMKKRNDNKYVSEDKNGTFTITIPAEDYNDPFTHCLNCGKKFTRDSLHHGYCSDCLPYIRDKELRRKERLNENITSQNIDSKIDNVKRG